MNKQNDWKQLAQDDIEEYERRQKAKPRWVQSALNVMYVVMLFIGITTIWWIGLEMDKSYMTWQINR